MPPWKHAQAKLARGEARPVLQVASRGSAVLVPSQAHYRARQRGSSRAVLVVPVALERAFVRSGTRTRHIQENNRENKELGTNSEKV